MNLKPSITLGLTAAGEYRVLYVGRDAAAARAAMNEPPADVLQVEIYRRPVPWKRRKFEAGAEAFEPAGGAPAGTGEAPVLPIAESVNAEAFGEDGVEELSGETPERARGTRALPKAKRK
jgi:hypothetical protein